MSHNTIVRSESQPMYLPLLSVVLFVVWSTTFTHAFTTPPSCQMTARTHAGSLYARDDDFDIEAARQQLESMVPSDQPSQQARQPWPLSARHVDHHYQDLDDPLEPPQYVPATVDMPDLPPPPPLTSMERERRLAEIRLLQQLEFGDSVISDLWNLWFQERGPDAAKRLWHVEELTTQGPRHWHEVESELRALIEEHGVRWAEPVNRLATLLYMQGRLEEAEEMALAVLAVKPWHFGALSGLVMIYAGQQEPMRARQWAARRLPTYCPGGLNRRRESWVQEAVTQVRDAMAESKERLRASFGAPDDHTTPGKNHDEDSTWQ